MLWTAGAVPGGRQGGDRGGGHLHHQQNGGGDGAVHLPRARLALPAPAHLPPDRHHLTLQRPGVTIFFLKSIRLAHQGCTFPGPRYSAPQNSLSPHPPGFRKRQIVLVWLCCPCLFIGCHAQLHSWTCWGYCQGCLKHALWERSGTERAVAGAQVKLLRTKFVEALGAEGRHLVDVNTIDGFQVAHNTSPSFPTLLQTCTMTTANAMELRDRCSPLAPDFISNI